MLRIVAWSSVFLALAPSPALGADDASFRMGRPIVSGNGCRSGTFGFTHAPDQRTLSFLFDEFRAEAGSNRGKSSIRGCRIAIPVQVPRGYSMAIGHADYRGFVILPERSSAVLTATAGFSTGARRAPASPRRLSHRWRTGAGQTLDESFPSGEELFRNSARGLLSSRCGGVFYLILESSFRIDTHRALEPALGGVDSIEALDGGSAPLGVEYRLAPCRR